MLIPPHQKSWLKSYDRFVSLSNSLLSDYPLVNSTQLYITMETHNFEVRWIIELGGPWLPWHAKVLSLKELHLAIAVEGMSPNILLLTEKRAKFLRGKNINLGERTAKHALCWKGDSFLLKINNQSTFNLGGTTLEIMVWNPMDSHSHLMYLIWLILIFPMFLTPNCRHTVEKFKSPIIWRRWWPCSQGIPVCWTNPSVFRFSCFCSRFLTHNLEECE